MVYSCQKDPEAPTLSLINQDLLYLKKGNSGPEKIVLSLHKFPAIIFNDDDIEERTSRWVNKCVKKFNPYARYGVEHWKNPHAKIFYIRKQKEPKKPKEEIYSNSKIVQVIKTYWELGHEHKFVTEIVARRANDCIISITKPDYKNLNKNDIEDIYLLIMNGKIKSVDYVILYYLSRFAAEESRQPETEGLDSRSPGCFFRGRRQQIMAPTTRRGPNTPVNDTNPNNMDSGIQSTAIDRTKLFCETPPMEMEDNSSHGITKEHCKTCAPWFYADFMKFHFRTLRGLKGMYRGLLTRWIEKMESVFNISGCAIENQVKFATCTLLGAALTWWNGQIRTLGPEAYAMTWEVLKKKVARHVLSAGLDKFTSEGLPDNIYGNVKSARPKTLDETIELANDLMDQKLRTYIDKAKYDKRGRRKRKLMGGSLPKNAGNTNVANTQKGNGAAPKGNGCFEGCGEQPGHFH
ncbi:hypothetical protein Tco_0993142 [Tanacetum coccineum]|uniref:Reverse transcriptase domain-containing protein n=1 Tax=Tanacetum coccineum TaxID=301880 RepID=A0ABQ5F4S9_9ASTR